MAAFAQALVALSNDPLPEAVEGQQGEADRLAELLRTDGILFKSGCSVANDEELTDDDSSIYEPRWLQQPLGRRTDPVIMWTELHLVLQRSFAADVRDEDGRQVDCGRA